MVSAGTLLRDFLLANLISPHSLCAKLAVL